MSRCKECMLIWGAVAIVLLAMPPAVFGFTLTVQEPNGAPVSGYRWLVEQDTTTYTTPGALVADSMSLDIHNSYAPVVLKGHSATATTEVNVPGGLRYIVSVLPDEGHAMSGKLVDLNQSEVTVVVNPFPIPTAQITVLAFEDHNPINNAPDGTEPGLEGFSVVIAEIGGQQMMDAFGNMLGTTYQQDLVTGEFLLDPDGVPLVEMMGTGIIKTDANGEATIKYLAPGKYGVQVIPPAGSNWIQTATIEGTKVIDAWVKANEPPYFIEGFGAGFYHVFFGYVDRTQLPWAVTPPDPATATGSITGTVVYNHFSRPPYVQGFFPGEPVGGAWVGLNDPVTGQGLYAAPCDENSSFTIDNVPPGTYQLVTWDENLLALFGFNTVVVPPGPSGTGDAVDLQNVLSFRWFATFEGSVFYDTDGDGFRDPDEVGIPEQNVNIRFRDGTVYQAQPTDVVGEWSLEAVFPFFKWLVVEVDFARFKATGMTAIVDGGGEVLPDDGWNMPSRDKLNPQVQIDMDPASPTFGEPIINPNTGNALSRTETGPVLTQAMHAFLTQTNIIDWGKQAYGPTENGGISGIVFYDTTRAENDPRFGAGEPWQPGIPRVQVALYQYEFSPVIPPEADPLLATRYFIKDLNGDGGPTLADVDNHPFGWQDDPNLFGEEDIDRNANGSFDAGDAIQIVTTDSWDDNKPTGSIGPILNIHGQQVYPGYDGFGTWNQIRPGIFDGGYAFASYFPGGIDSGSEEVDGLPSGTYIVEATTPPGYELVKEQDKNVDFGDEYIPSPQLLPPICVGDLHLVPDELSLFPGVECFYAGQTRPLADRKQLILSAGKNAAADFFFFTEVPKAARAVGFVNNDLSAEFDTTSPVFGEKSAPSWIPISIQDWAGNELGRVYSDEYGSYNAMIPSTFTINVPAPSGVAPHLVTVVLNHPGPIPDPCNPGNMIVDPYYDPSYSTTPWTLHYYPGATTYLDTPLVPVAAFAGYPNGALDTEPPDGTPVIFSAEGPAGGPVLINAGDVLVITAVGDKWVPNPDYDPTDPASTATVKRDYGFGILQGSVTVNGVALTINSWTNTQIEAVADFGATTTGTLVVHRIDTGKASDLNLTVHIAPTANVIHVSSAPWPAHPIQDAIDAAASQDLIVVHPGTYSENVILYKDLILQGSGAESTIINANPQPPERLGYWHNKIVAILGNDPFAANECPGIMVLGNAGFTFGPGSSGVIDGFGISGSLAGSGIYVNSFAHYLEIRNNRVQGNQGSWSGGIAIGTPQATDKSTNVNIHHNYILKNGGIEGGGGISIYSGADNYVVRDNLIMGNFSRYAGGGILHAGLSLDGLIEGNRIVSNEVFYGMLVPGGGDGGGIFLGSELPTTTGAGSVTVNRNLIQGNLAGAGSGGGIRALLFNGDDVTANPADPAAWYSLNIFNNLIVNNVAANAGGGIALQDAAQVSIINNTVANNDSTATAALTFPPGNLLQSEPQGAGIVSAAHSAALAAASGQAFSDPVLHDNIIWHNSSFYWDGTLNGSVGGILPNPAGQYQDLAVSGVIGGMLDPQHCLLSSAAGDPTNITGDPFFVDGYSNTLLTAAVLDEGGNAITTRFAPIGIRGNYHILPASPAVGSGGGVYLGTYAQLDSDFDGQVRAGVSDIGGDQVTIAGAPVEVIVDNLDAGTSSIGLWSFSGAPGFWATDSVWSRTEGGSFTFTADLVPGTAYAVYGWWTQWPSRYTAVPYEIRDGVALLETVNVNQQVNGGQWNLLGVYVFSDIPSVTILATPGTWSTSADAVRFVPVTLQSVEIIGPATVSENSVTDYDAVAHFSGGISMPVEPQLWVVNVPQASIDSAGVLTTTAVSADTPAVVAAQYTLDGITLGDTQNVTILNSAAVEMIVDNLDAGTSSVGLWLASGAPGFYATDSVWSRTEGGSFTFSADLAPGTTYAIYEWHTQWPTRYTAVPHQIRDGGALLDTVNVNQQVSGGQWNLLGTFTFTGTASVTILATPGTWTTCADAIRFVPVAPAEVIVDNHDAGTSSVGTWPVSSAPGFWGTDSVWSRTDGGSFTFTASLMPGTYDLYAWWTEWPSRYTAVPHQIRDGGTLLDTVNMNQQTNGGQWNLLGRYTFGGTAGVTILATPGTWSTAADAVRFVPVP